MTMYKNAVQPASSKGGQQNNGIKLVEIPLNKNREISSSEEPMDTSDEVDKLDYLDINRQHKIDQFISDVHHHSHEVTSDDMM